MAKKTIKNKWHSRLHDELSHNLYNIENVSYRISLLKNQLFTLIGNKGEQAKINSVRMEYNKAKYDFNSLAERINTIKRLIKTSNRKYEEKIKAQA